MIKAGKEVYTVRRDAIATAVGRIEAQLPPATSALEWDAYARAHSYRRRHLTYYTVGKKPGNYSTADRGSETDLRRYNPRQSHKYGRRGGIPESRNAPRVSRQGGHPD